MESFPYQIPFMLVVSFAFVPLIVSYKRVEAVNDLYQGTLNPRRVQAGLIFGLAAAWLVTLLEDFNSIHPLWMVISGVTVFYLASISLGSKNITNR